MSPDHGFSDQIEQLIVRRGEWPADGLFLEHYFRYRFAEKFTKNVVVLDCACGTGYGTYLLSRKAKEIVGIDRSTEALKIAAENWTASNIRYLQLDIDHLETIQEKFDVIVSFETIEHLANAENFVGKSYHLLSQNGCFIVSTPNKGIYRAEVEPNPFHLHEFSPAEFFNLLSKKFSQVEVFAQIKTEPIKTHQDSIRGGARLPFLSKFRIKLAAMLIRNPFGYFLYLLRMQKRFSVIGTQDHQNYQYLIAVCRK